jgi:hypothetical protein
MVNVGTLARMLKRNTALPRSFCFEEVDTAPRFLQRSLRRKPTKFRTELKWFRMDLNMPEIHGDSYRLIVN